MSRRPSRSDRRMLRALGIALVSAVVLWPVQAWAQDRIESQMSVPRLEATNGVVVLSRLPPILGDEEVRRHLDTGLTTTLALRVEARDARGKVEGGAVVTIRFDLWDEVFHVAWVGAAGRPGRAPFESFEGLESWWRDLRLGVLSTGAGRPTSQARLVIDVVPFSAAEARDTQRWFSETLDDAKTSSAEDATTEESSDTLGRTFRLMMATSIQRRSIRVFRYEPEFVPVGRRATP